MCRMMLLRMNEQENVYSTAYLWVIVAELGNTSICSLRIEKKTFQDKYITVTFLSTTPSTPWFGVTQENEDSVN